jgi:hypothetical protein
VNVKDLFFLAQVVIILQLVKSSYFNNFQTIMHVDKLYTLTLGLCLYKCGIKDVDHYHLSNLVHNLYLLPWLL